MAEKDSDNPTKVFQCGRIKAAIWEGQKVIDNTIVNVHTIKIDRSYKDDDEEWKHTNLFYSEDLPKIAMVASEAYKFIRLRSFDKSNSDNNAIEEQEED
ncbi:MAG: hypothetical protein ACYS74_02765 [Planctomycetota bacterium]|jgi:hypothetical protein